MFLLTWLPADVARRGAGSTSMPTRPPSPTAAPGTVRRVAPLPSLLLLLLPACLPAAAVDGAERPGAAAAVPPPA